MNGEDEDFDEWTYIWVINLVKLKKEKEAWEYFFENIAENLFEGEERIIDIFLNTVALLNELSQFESTPFCNIVNTHPIWIDTRNSKGEIVKKILVESGASLPAQKGLDFIISSEHSIQFALYQGNKLIKHFTHNFENIPPIGSKVTPFN